MSVELEIEKELGIATIGRNDDHSDTFRYPYEPTDYEVLDRIVEDGYITKDDCLVDYGSGKGRVPIYMHYKTGCRTIGIEMMNDFIEIANQNKETFYKKNLLHSTESHNGKEISIQERINMQEQTSIHEQIQFVCEKAEKWKVDKEVTCFFFFNPFSLKILRGVMKKILDSYYDTPRNIKLLFYYPQDEYVAFLTALPELNFVDEIDCRDLFTKRDLRNRVIIYELP